MIRVSIDKDSEIEIIIHKLTKTLSWDRVLTFFIYNNSKKPILPYFSEKNS